jgi:copper chaperone NosL
MMLLANCQGQAFEPVALSHEDMCAYCKMAISEKRYAAELIDHEGQAFKFDDIGCLTNFIRRGNPQASAYFVMDFDERQWIRAEDAYYIRSSEFTTPMNGGIVAFKNESRARDAADRYQGKIVHLNEVLK